MKSHEINSTIYSRKNNEINKIVFSSSTTNFSSSATNFSSSYTLLALSSLSQSAFTFSTSSLNS